MQYVRCIASCNVPTLKRDRPRMTPIYSSTGKPTSSRLKFRLEAGPLTVDIPKQLKGFCTSITNNLNYKKGKGVYLSIPLQLHATRGAEHAEVCDMHMNKRANISEIYFNILAYPQHAPHPTSLRSNLIVIVHFRIA